MATPIGPGLSGELPVSGGTFNLEVTLCSPTSGSRGGASFQPRGNFDPGRRRWHRRRHTRPLVHPPMVGDVRG